MTRPLPTDTAKAELRRALAARRRCAAAAAPDAAEAVCARALAGLRLPPAAVVSGYWPLRDELDPRPLMLALAARGHRLALPVVTGKARPLRFRAWAPGQALVAAAFGTQIPPEGAEEITPQVLLVPLLAFDRRGCRLGYGGGFYDRTLAGLRAAGGVLAVGLAYADQACAALPVEPTDQPLDVLVTERELLTFA